MLRFSLLSIFVFLTWVSACTPAMAQAWVTKSSKWYDFQQIHFQVAEHSAYVVIPDRAAAGKPWVWRARFPGYHDEMDQALVRQGFHLGYVDVAGLFGGPEAMKIGDQFYDFVTRELQLSKQPALEGVSRGGLFVYNWAAANPGKVSCVYCDTPVCDFKSWPGGKGKGPGSTSDWTQCLKVYGLTEAEALEYKQNPIDHAGIIAKAKIPLMHIVSENDQVVPPSENTYLLQKALSKLGHSMEVISLPTGTAESHGHHFTHPQPQRVVKFIAKHAGLNEQHTERMQILRDAKRIVFVGDSITYAGTYVSLFEAWLYEQDLQPVVINVGLPSETVSGLSEEGHAGGQFPRPDLAERLDRVLTTTRPDLVIACYGMNCGIYQPFDEQRFKAYQEGITALKTKVEAAGAKLILVTPPSFDDQRTKQNFSYDDVLAKYAQWLTSKRAVGWQVIDLHSAMLAELQRRRTLDPQFTFQNDAVHPNAEGHRVIAKSLIHWFAGREPDFAKVDESFSLINQRMELLRDAYLSASGHQRPGIRAGLPIDQAEAKADQLIKSLFK